MVKYLNADDALRGALILRFAEVGEDGRPQRCTCVEHKIVFETREALEGFIRMAHELDGQTRRAYPCHRGGWHFTSDGTKNTAKTPEEFPDAT